MAAMASLTVRRTLSQSMLKVRVSQLRRLETPSQCPAYAVTSTSNFNNTLRWHSTSSSDPGKKSDQNANKDKDRDSNTKNEDKPDDSGQKEMNSGEDPATIGAAGSLFALAAVRLALQRGMMLTPGLQVFAALPLLVGVLEQIRQGKVTKSWFAVPLGALTLWGANSFQEKRRIENLISSSCEELRDCPDLPVEAAKEALRAGTAKEFESNRLSVQAEWPPAEEEANVRWLIEVKAKRSHGLESWQSSSIRVSQASGRRNLTGAHNPPPQTRKWNPSGDAPAKWALVWEKS